MKKIIVANLIVITVVVLATLGLCYGIIVRNHESIPALSGSEPMPLYQERLLFDYNRLVYDDCLVGVFSPDSVFQFVFYNGTDSEPMIVTSKDWAKNALADGTKPISQRIPDYIAQKGYDRIAVVPLLGEAPILSDIKTMSLDEARKEHNENLIDWELKSLEINVDEDEFQKIVDKREEAIQRGILLTEDADVVSAKIRASGRKYKAEIRLKGDWVDHLLGDQWSFRIELKGDNCIYGMQKFSVQAPETRNGIWEPIMYRAYQEMGGVTLRYDFIDVFLNGEYKGVYALEEFPEKRVIENSLFREGPILKLDEDYLWLHRAFYSGEKGWTRFLHVMTTFSEKKTIMSGQLANYAKYAITGYTKVRSGEIPAEQVFDIEKCAQLNALRAVFAAKHALAEHNQRHYYNPITGLLEPLPFDEEPALNSEPIYFAEYYGYLLKNREYLDSFSDNIDSFCMDFNSFMERNSADFQKMRVMLERMNAPDEGMARLSARVDSISGALHRYEEVQISKAIYSAQLGGYALRIENPNPYPVWLNDTMFIIDGAPAAGDSSAQRQIVIEGKTTEWLPIPKALFPQDAAVSVSTRIGGAYFEEYPYTAEINNSLRIRFSVIGHAYGDHNYGDGLDETVLAYLQKEKVKTTLPLSFCFFTGDMVDGTVEEDYADFGAITRSLPFDCYCVRGNHDKNFPELCAQNFGAASGSFFRDGSLFIWLDADITNGWNISEEQLEMIRDALQKHSDPDNVFVLTHEAIWWEHDNADRFGAWMPNSGASCGYDTENKPNFYSDVLPLFDGLDCNLYWIAGDAGCNPGKELFYLQDGKISYMAAGVGDGNKDSALEFYIMEDGAVNIDLVELDPSKAGKFGEIYAY